MKRILGIISLILGVVVFFAYCVSIGIARGLTIGNAILSVVIAMAISLAIVGWIWFTLLMLG